jgi:hypothetical protein
MKTEYYVSVNVDNEVRLYAQSTPAQQRTINWSADISEPTEEKTGFRLLF